MVLFNAKDAEVLFIYLGLLVDTAKGAEVGCLLEAEFRGLCLSRISRLGIFVDSNIVELVAGDLIEVR
jgi:hypothetical protein